MSTELCSTPDNALVAEVLSRRGVTAVRIETRVQPAAGDLLETGPGLDQFEFHHRGHLDYLLPELRRHLRRRLGPRDRTRLIAEVCFWVRWFSSLTGDRRPATALFTAGTDLATHLDALAATGDGLTMVAEFGRGDLGCRQLHVFKGAAAAQRLAGSRPPGTVVLVSRTIQELVPPELPAGEPQRRADVLLISMPFVPLNQPSLGLSLLACTIPGRTVRVLYPMLAFAERIGSVLYNSISEGEPNEAALIGEWLFAHEVFDRSGDADAKYIQDFLGDVSPSWMQALDCVRAHVRPFLDSLVQTVVAHQPRFVGLSSTFQQHMAALALARRIRRTLPDCRIVLGGANCEGAMGAELVRQFDFVDAAVSGEGEQVFPLLVDATLGARPLPLLPGVHVRGSTTAAHTSIARSVMDMDALPYPDFDDFYEQWNKSAILRRNEPRLFFETSRGCWWGQKHHCTFCGLNGASMQYRSKSGERALQELKHLLSRYPTRSIQVVDNILDMKYFETFLPRIESERLQLDLYYEVKANLRRDQVMQLARAGVRCLQPGIESLSDPILRLMRKGVTALQNIQLLRLCKENGIHAYWNLICGFPGEPEAEYLRMAQLVPLLAHLTPPVVCGPLRLDRFSPNFERPAEHGFRNVRPRPAYSHIYPFAPASVADLAYFFDFDHADGAQPERYSAALVEAVEEWQLDHQQSHLVFVDKGDVAFVFDLRPTARHSSRSLAGVDRAVLLACCDRIQTQESLRTLFAERGKPIDQTELQDSLARLVEDRFAIRHDSRYLGLPLDANSLGSSLVQREQRADDALVARA